MRSSLIKLKSTLFNLKSLSLLIVTVAIIAAVWKNTEVLFFSLTGVIRLLNWEGKKKSPLKCLRRPTIPHSMYSILIKLNMGWAVFFLKKKDKPVVPCSRLRNGLWFSFFFFLFSFLL